MLIFVSVKNPLLDNNGLTGPIPSEIGMITSLEVFSSGKLMD